MSGTRNKFGKDKEKGANLETKLARTYFISRICEGHGLIYQIKILYCLFLKYYCSFTDVHTVSLVSLENMLTRGYHKSFSSTPKSPSMSVVDDLLLLNDEAFGSLQAHQKLMKYFEHSKNGWCHPNY